MRQILNKFKLILLFLMSNQVVNFGTTAVVPASEVFSGFDFDKIASEAATLATMQKSRVNEVMQYFGFKEGVPVKGVFIGCGMHSVYDMERGESKILKCAFWADQNADIQHHAAKQLVGVLETFQIHQRFEVTYLGKFQNKNNSKMSAKFKIYKEQK